MPRLNDHFALVREVLGGLAGRPADLATWVPSNLKSRFDRMTHNDNTGGSSDDQDPLVSIERDLPSVSSLETWESIARRLSLDEDELSRYPLAVRSSIGSRLEQGIRILSPESGSSTRLDFLRDAGHVLLLQPTPREWISLALERGVLWDTWMATSFPGSAHIARFITGRPLVEIARVVSAVPVDQRLDLLNSVLLTIDQAGDDDEDSLLSLARAFTETGDPTPVRKMRLKVPKYRAILGGWLAATGDDQDLEDAIELLSSDVSADRIDRYLNFDRIGWLEEALARNLLWPAEVGYVLLFASEQAYRASTHNRRILSLGNALATAACATSPAETALYLEAVRQFSKRPEGSGPFDDLFKFAVDRALEMVGRENAAAALGIASDSVRGRRVLTEFKKEWI
jgi:hypothetical protein